MANKTVCRAFWRLVLAERAKMEEPDGTTKIFLNMTSKNGSKELISLLQYMKNTDINNPEILVKDERIVELDSIVTEVKSSEEWEDAIAYFDEFSRKLSLNS